MNNRGKTTPKKPKGKGLGFRNKQDESSEEEPLIVAKVVKQYTRKKKVDHAEAINKLHTINIGTVWPESSNSMYQDNNHVKIKEEIMERYPDIEMMPLDIDTANHVKIEETDESENGASIEDRNNSVEIKEENIQTNSQRRTQIVEPNIIQNYTYTTTYTRINCNVEIKETDSSRINDTIIKVNGHQHDSNKNSDIIKVKEEKDDKVMDNFIPIGAVKQTEEITIKQETEDDAQNVNLEQRNTYMSGTDDSKSGAVKIKQTDASVGKLHNNDKMDSSCNVIDVKENIPIFTAQQTLQANANVQKPLSKILITEEIHIKEEVTDNHNTAVGCTEMTRNPPVEEKKQSVKKKIAIKEEPVMKLKRIVNMPRLLRTYGRKQPETTALKKCFLIAVNPPSANTKMSPQQLAKIQAKAAARFTCDMCDMSFKSRASVSSHVRFVHSAITMKFKCEVCSAWFHHYYQLLAHARTHTGAPLACDLCPARFKTKEKYGEHLNTHLRERLYPCPICLQRYTKLPHLQRHAERHSQDVFTCNTCMKTYRCFMELSRHSERDHDEKAEFPCYVCNRVLSSNAEFLTHVKTHDNVMYPCAFCPSKISDALTWEKHSNGHIERTDSEEPVKPYICDYCKKTFQYQSVLITHIRMHTGERPYECSRCGKKLKTQSALTEHFNAHDRPHPCLYCDRRFGKRDSLSRHLLLHTGERPHACSSCPLTFTQRSSLMLHRRRFHEPCLKRVWKTKKKNVKKIKRKRYPSTLEDVPSSDPN